MGASVILLLFTIVTILIAVLFFYSKSKFKEQDKKINEVEKKNIVISTTLKEQIEGYKNYTNERIKEYKKDTDRVVKQSYDNIELFLKRIQNNYDKEEDARADWVRMQEISNKSRDSKINAINNDVTSIKTMIGMFKDTKELNALKKAIKEASIKDIVNQ